MWDTSVCLGVLHEVSMIIDWFNDYYYAVSKPFTP